MGIAGRTPPEKGAAGRKVPGLRRPDRLERIGRVEPQGFLHKDVASRLESLAGLPGVEENRRREIDGIRRGRGQRLADVLEYFAGAELAGHLCRPLLDDVADGGQFAGSELEPEPASAGATRLTAMSPAPTRSHFRLIVSRHSAPLVSLF